MIRALAILALAAVAGAQSYNIPISGGATNSEVTVPVPPPPATATQAVIRLDHRAQFFHGWETNVSMSPGVSGGCAWTAMVTMRQGYRLTTNGQQIASQRATSVFARTGACVTFDGAYDWGGPSGGNSGWLVRPTSVTATVPVASLGPTLTIRTEARSYTDLLIECQAQIPITGGWIDGNLAWANLSYWEGDLHIAYE